MRRCGRWLVGLVLLASVAMVGCGTATSVAVTLSPATVTVLANGVLQFTASVTGSTTTPTAVWAVNGVTGGNTTVGTISTGGLYTAPATVPLSSTNPVTPTVITVTATVSSSVGTATVTIDSGVRVSISPQSFTIGTSEQFAFKATVTGVTSNTVGPSCGPPPQITLCTAVTWSILPAATSSYNPGSINPNTGVYIAPTAIPTNAAQISITASSVLDPSETGTADIFLATAADPTGTSISPAAGALGAIFQDITLTGTNFISTTNVFINHQQLPSQNILNEAGSTTLHVRVPDSFLAQLPTPPASETTLVFTVARQGGAEQLCSPDPTTCQLVLSPVRPAIVGTTPDSIPQGTSGAINFTVNGGFFGTPNTPVVIAKFAGETKLPQIGSDDRQLNVTINGSDVSTPGLFPVGVFSDVLGDAPGTPRAVANLAVQPAYSSPPSVSATLPVGTTPAAVAIDTLTGIALVANQGSNDITFIDTTQPAPTVVGFLCTGMVGAGSTATESLGPDACPLSGPVSVAVDNTPTLHIALVANSMTGNVAVINLDTRTVTTLVSALVNGGVTPPTPFAPAAVGINPVSGRALLVYSSTNNASIIDLTQSPPVIIGTVGISTGLNPRISVSPRLNWALVTPGGLGTLSIVDLAQQRVNFILQATSNGAVRSAGTVTITTSAVHTLEIGESVLIQGVADASFNGVFTVASVPSSTTFTYTQSATLANATSGGGTANYALPVAVLGTSLTMTGVAFNDETQKAILVDPTGSTAGFIFNALDQSSTSLSLQPGVGNVGAAINPLANLGVVVNQTNKQAFVVDPTTPAVLATIAVGNKPVDVAIDPGTNIAVIVNQADNTVSVVPLGALRAPQILQASVQPGPSFPGLSVLVHSTLSSAATPVDQTVTIIGKGLANSMARLDGTVLPLISRSDRVMTVTVPAAMQLSPRRYALDVVDSGTSAVSNAASFTVIQSVDLTSGACPAPSPVGVAIDPQHNIAAVTEPGCTPGNVALINLAGGSGAIGTGPTVQVGTTPLGVGILAQAGLAVVANEGSNTASVIDVVGADVTNTVSTDSGPNGVAVDSSTGNALVTAAAANTVNIFSVQSPGTPTSLGVQQGPTGVGVDSTIGFAAVANATSNSVSVLSEGAATVTSQVSGFSFPTGITFDPISNSFLVVSSLQNQVEVLNVATDGLSGLRVGINPTSIAYNVATGTLVTTNSLSQTMTVIDFLDRTVRAVFPVTPAGLYAVDIHALTNLAVVADSANNRVLLLPLPR